MRDDYDDQIELGSFKARTLAHPVDEVRIWWKPARTPGVLRVQISSSKEELVRFIRDSQQIALDGAGYLTLDDLQYRLADDRRKAEQLLDDIDTYCPAAGETDDTANPTQPDDDSPWQDPATVEETVTEAQRREAVERLRELKSLHDEGILTDDEYQQKRQRLVDMI